MMLLSLLFGRLVHAKSLPQGFTEPNCDEKLDMLQQIRHENFVAFLESFRFQECSYAVLQHVSISLVQIVASPPYPTELQLAAIIGQVRRPLAPKFTLTGTDPQRHGLSQIERLGSRVLNLLERPSQRRGGR